MIRYMWNRRLLRLLCMVKILSPVGASQAQEPPNIAPTPPLALASSAGHAPAEADEQSALAARERKILAIYAEAKEQYKNGRFLEAIETYKQGYEKFGSPIFLINIGRMYHKMGDLYMELEFYQKYLSLPVKLQQAALTRLVIGYVALAQLALARSGLPPAPHRLDIAGEPPQVSQSLRRPRWRLGLGVSLALLSTASLAYGIAGLLLNRHCADDTPTMGACGRYYNSGETGLAFSIVGVVGSSGSILLATWPASASSLREQMIGKGGRLSIASFTELGPKLTSANSYSLLP